MTHALPHLARAFLHVALAPPLAIALLVAIVSLLSAGAMAAVGTPTSVAWLVPSLDWTIRHEPGWVVLWMAWLAVATPLNIAVWLRSAGWTADAVVWPVLVIAAVAAVGAWLVSRTADLAAAAVLVWAFVAIGVEVEGVLRGTIVAAVVVTVVALALGARRHSLWPTAHAHA